MWMHSRTCLCSKAHLALVSNPRVNNASKGVQRYLDFLWGRQTVNNVGPQDDHTCFCSVEWNH